MKGGSSNGKTTVSKTVFLSSNLGPPAEVLKGCVMDEIVGVLFVFVMFGLGVYLWSAPFLCDEDDRQGEFNHALGRGVGLVLMLLAGVMIGSYIQEVYQWAQLRA